MSVDRTYCLICRQEMVTETGQICGKCSCESRSVSVLDQLRSVDADLSAKIADARKNSVKYSTELWRLIRDRRKIRGRITALESGSSNVR